MVVNNEYSPFPKGSCSFFVESVDELKDVPGCPCGSVVIDLSTGDMYVCFPTHWRKWGSDEIIEK